ncbi:hypothetical protein uvFWCGRAMDCOMC440_055 [Freshwater phage uvFW-CGR-AMD-COM-C440]|nr:hypothetical protein uvFWCGRAMDCOMC440_055 [Freshwater phage uvFW-CGR-AMD-COM-C440]
MKEITFTNVLGLDFFPPKPAVKEVPDWYKKTPEYIGDKGKTYTNGGTPHTIKKCIPVFDAMTAGYILYTQVDVQVTQEDGLPYYTWAGQDAISFHPIDQAPVHPNMNGASYPKWNNPYAIKTSSGYSTLFIPPMHNPNGVFNILPGLVDTDTYKAPVNFPFTLNDVKWEGLIPAGTPMVQIIPIKRDIWEHKIGSDSELKEQNLISAKLKTLFFNSYKRQFWSRKEYK